MKTPVRISLIFCLLLVRPGTCLKTELRRANETVRSVLPIQEFDDHLAEYLKVRKAAQTEVARLKPTNSPEAITDHERALALKIRESRPQAKEGDIFSTAISAEFRRRIADTMRGPEAARIQKSLKRAEPVHVPLRVNEVYPGAVPLQSTPPTLLLNLPKLPPEIEYRVVAHALVLRDVEANLIVDFVRDAVP